MTDWKTIAAARCPDMPDDAVARIVPVLEALEKTFRPLAAGLTRDDEPAAVFVPERGE